MPRYTANGTPERPPTRSYTLSPFDHECLGHLVGHTLALVKRELILQTLRYVNGNRTRAADLLGISIRSLRDHIRKYKSHGESVPKPESPPAPTIADGERPPRPVRTSPRMFG